MWVLPIYQAIADVRKQTLVVVCLLWVFHAYMASVAQLASAFGC